MANPKLKPNQFLLPCGAMITERPILFSTDMVKANLEDRKTQTRRTKGFDQLQYQKSRWFLDISILGNFFFKHKDYPDQSGIQITCPYGEPGDLLWVRETWGVTGFDYPMYKADYDSKNDIRNALINDRWKPSIHMPKIGSRIWVMVEEIRVERLQEISEEDAKAEGILPIMCPIDGVENLGYKNYFKGNMPELPKASFHSLWAYINGEASWNSNPWVWVVKYRILSKTGRPSNEIIEKNYLEVTKPKP